MPHTPKADFSLPDFRKVIAVVVLRYGWRERQKFWKKLPQLHSLQLLRPFLRCILKYLRRRGEPA
jgi:DTW domain-containing protein YfiP